MDEECPHYNVVIDPNEDSLYERCDLDADDRHAFHHYVPMCRELNDRRYHCTRAKDHVGPHVARHGSDGGGVMNDQALATWGNRPPMFASLDEADAWLEVNR